MGFIAIQGLGGGGIFSITQIILSDLVHLRERGIFNGLVVMYAFRTPSLLSSLDYPRAWAVASGVGPVVGGSLSQRGQWRWLFCSLIK